MKKTTLVFSTGYDSFVYKKDSNLFNKKFVGEMQLLEFLERELGLSGEFKDNKEREVEYLEFLTKELNTRETFISTSFNNDSIGVAKELLKWRDQLKLCNWDFKTGISKRLDLLAVIEQTNNLSLGITDRWILVLDNIKTTDDFNIESIEVNDNLELLHPIYKRIFNLLESKGVTITTKQIELNQKNKTNLSKIKDAIFNKIRDVELDKNDTSFQIIQFKDPLISADFLAQQLNNNNVLSPVIINSNNYALDTSFLTFNIPLSGSEISNVNPQIIQLFKLLSALLFTKVNPYNLLSLLNLPMLPFSKSLANKLSKVLINNAGIGNVEWNKTIEDYKTTIDKNKLKTIKLYIEREKSDKIKKQELIDIYRDLVTWTAKILSFENTDITKTQLSNLQMLSKNFIKTMESVEETEFTARELDKITSKIYDSISIAISGKEKDSYVVIKKPEQLYDNTDALVWFDFYNQNLSAKFCDFLMQSEIEKLEEQEAILLWKKEHQIQLQLDNWQKGILKTEKKLCLFISEKTTSEATTEHPLFTQLTSSINNLEDFMYDFSFENTDWMNDYWKELNLTNEEKIELPKECDSITINNTALLKKRTTESYSSVNDLIQNPLDWVLNYQAKITEKGLGDIDELITLKGNLSHQIVQVLLQNEKEGKLVLSKVDIDIEIDKLLEEYTPQMASPFYLDEHTFEYKAFVDQLKKSFKVLLKIITNNNLEYHSNEYEATGKIGIIGFGGKIDLLFYQKEKPVIIDLKWTFSSKKYATILEEEKSMQLAMYAKLMDCSSAITGYFLLSDASLYTTNKLLTGEGIKNINLQEDFHYVNDRIIHKTINSFNYRWNEFNEGKIEASEEMLLDGIKYHNDTESENLIPLDVKDKKYKKANPYSSYGLFKGKVK